MGQCATGRIIHMASSFLSHKMKLTMRFIILEIKTFAEAYFSKK